MQRTVLSRDPFSRFFAAAVLVLCLFASGSAQSVPPVVEQTSQIAELLRQGHALEAEQRWGEAFGHYEGALRRFPNTPTLRRRFDFTRLHYNLSRRYNDRSFCEVLSKLSLEETLDLYGEVLLKVQIHYVEVPHWKELIERGTNCFEIALSDPLFRSQNGIRVEESQIDQFRAQLRRTLGPQMVNSRSEARRSVGLAAEMAEQSLGVPASAVALEYVSGAANLLDLYSAYLTPNQLDEIYSQIEGNFVGLGVELKADDGALLIVRVISGSPADESGLVPNDRIVAINDKPIADLSSDRAANLLQGEVDSTVRLSIVSPKNDSRQLTVRRKRIEVPSIDNVRILEPALHIGYLKLTCFQKTTSRDLETALWQLHRAGMKSLIIDLRDNPGGLLVTAVEVVDKFVEEGVIVSTHGRNTQEDYTYSARRPGTWRVPLVVLINQDSASAAEIFAGAIRDHRRGTIVGERSYGKGSVQGIFPLTTAKSGIRLTTAKFYSPTGQAYSGVGVSPDLTVHQVARPIDGSTEAALSPPDAMLDAAVEAAQQLIARR